MYGCESWTIKKAECWRIDAFELWCWRRLLRVPRTAKRSNQSILKEISSEYWLEGLMLKLQSIIWPPDAKNWLIGKDPDAGKDWRQKEKGMTQDEMVGWHHQLNGHEFEQAPRVGDGQESLECCSSQGHKESDMTEQLNWTESILVYSLISSIFIVYLAGKVRKALDLEIGLNSIGDMDSLSKQRKLFPYHYYPICKDGDNNSSHIIILMTKLSTIPYIEQPISALSSQI